MEEIKLGFPLNDKTVGLELFQELMGRAMSSGVQVGVPWTGSVYKYLFEEGSQNEVDEIFSNLYIDVTEDSFI